MAADQLSNKNYNIIKAHGGEIKAESKEWQDSGYIIELSN
jgi:hypothetical protein